jgi:hypothetical protein
MGKAAIKCDKVHEIQSWFWCHCVMVFNAIISDQIHLAGYWINNILTCLQGTWSESQLGYQLFWGVCQFPQSFQTNVRTVSWNRPQRPPSKYLPALHSWSLSPLTWHYLYNPCSRNSTVQYSKTQSLIGLDPTHSLQPIYLIITG